MTKPHHTPRRTAALCGALLTLVATLGKGSIALETRELSFYHTHTGKRLSTVYWRDGEYVPSALQAINRFLADFRSGETADIDPLLLDLIYDLRLGLGSEGSYHVISAYRSPATNEMLRNRSASSGVARQSQHLLGKAIDVRLEGVPTKTLHEHAIALGRGGVGYYETSDFLHLDTGRVRRW